MLIAAAACGRPFEVKTPQELVELPGHEQAHEYRATSPDGVVVAARAIDTEGRGDLAFWERAVTVKLRDQEGYALLEVRDVQSEDGTPGRQLRFGRDEEQRTYSYWVTLFVAQQRLFVMEAGGEGAAVDQYAQSLDWQVAHFEVRCQSWLAPVLASRTCNRW